MHLIAWKYKKDLKLPSEFKLRIQGLGKEHIILEGSQRAYSMQVNTKKYKNAKMLNLLRWPKFLGSLRLGVELLAFLFYSASSE